MEQILKGWVTLNQTYWVDEDELYLIKHDQGDLSCRDEGRQLRILIGNALSKLGFEDISTDNDNEEGISGRYKVDNIQMQLFSSDKRVKLDEIRKNVVLDAMGLLNFQETWYGYSTWTIEGYVTDTFMLGGHNILEILKQHEGKFVYLVIDVVH